MIVYYRLWDLLNRKGMKKTDLLKIMSSATLAKMNKNLPVTLQTIAAICGFLHCQPYEIMEYQEKFEG